MSNEIQAVKNMLFRIASEVESEARDKAPWRTGNLARDIQVFDSNINDLSISVGNSKLAPYAPYVHEGTGKRARNKSKTSGRIKKGGIKPNPYIEDGLNKYIQDGNLDRALEECGEEIGESFLRSIKANVKNAIVS